MGILQEGLNRRAFLLKSAQTAAAALLIPGCGEVADREARVRAGWNSMLTEQGKKVEADMAEAGIRNNSWYKLVPFEQLTDNQRTALGQDLPSSGFFFTTEDSGKKIITFLLLAEKKDGEKTILKLSASDSLIKNATFTEDTGPEAKLTFDLAKFIDYSIKPKDPIYDRGVFTITKYRDPRDYINTPQAITGVEFKGSKESLPPLAAILAK